MGLNLKAVFNIIVLGLAHVLVIARNVSAVQVETGNAALVVTKRRRDRVRGISLLRREVALENARSPGRVPEIEKARTRTVREVAPAVVRDQGWHILLSPHPVFIGD